MSDYFRLVDPGVQYFDDNGDVLAGGKLYTYAAGTTTNKASYRDDAGAAAHTNPIILDAAGRIPAGDGVFGTTGAYNLKLDDADDVNIWSRDDVTGINDTGAAITAEWYDPEDTPSFDSSTTFTVTGDKTSEYHIGRRVKITDGSGTDYGTIIDSSYSDPSTTVTCAFDAAGAVIDASISLVELGIISRDNSGSPASMVTIGRGEVSNVTALEITDLEAQYVRYCLFLYDANINDGSNSLELVVSNDNGSTWEEGATAYYAWYRWKATGLSQDLEGDIDRIPLGLDKTQEFSIMINIHAPMEAGARTGIHAEKTGFDVGTVNGLYKTAEAINAVRVQLSSTGDFDADWVLYAQRRA